VIQVEIAFWADDWPAGLRAAERRARAAVPADVALEGLSGDLRDELARRRDGRVVAVAPGGAWTIALEVDTAEAVAALTTWLAARPDVPRSTTMIVAGGPATAVHPRLRDW